MTDRTYFSALPDCWEVLRNSDEPIFVYGMGNGGDKIISECERRGIEVSGVFCSDGFERGKVFRGFPVKTLGEVEEECSEFTVLLAFGTSLPDVMGHIDEIERRHRLFAPEVSVIGGEAFSKEKFLENFHRAERAYQLLGDDISRKVFEGLTAYKITGRLEFLREIFGLSEGAGKLFEPEEDESYCDLGAYNGDTVLEFVRSSQGRYRRIYALEPEKRNFQKCVKRCMHLDNIEFYNAAAWSVDGEIAFDGGSGRQAKVSCAGKGRIAARSLDSVLGGRECTYIKYDVEGADIPALRGSAETLRKFTPKICCALYHRCYDYIDIPLCLDEICGGYSFYMRQDVYYPAWETNLFAVKR